MKIIKSIAQLKKAVHLARRQGQTVGFAPTMGYFHEGHLSLMRRAKKECDITVVSIFVNPKQFGPKEDLSRYPRDLRRDSTLAKKESVDILFVPPDNVVYPKGYLTYIDIEKLPEHLCGAFRPGHFRGVATVVAKLLNIVQPDVMYLGQKDAQQAAVLFRMVEDLNVPVAIRVVPTVREKDGLAMSSRNLYLNAQERQEAPVLYRALQGAVRQVRAGERRASKITGLIRQIIARNSSGQIQYVACVDAKTLKPLKTLKGRVLIALSVFFGETRLIDNVFIQSQSRHFRLRGHRLTHRQKHQDPM